MDNGVQLHRRVQDENAGLGPTVNNKQQQPAPPSARKAFGNITNTNKGLGQGDNPAGGVGAPPKPRRALGELSVNRRAAVPQQQEQQKQQVVAGGSGDGGTVAAAATPAATPQSEGDLAWRYARDGVERWAGKTWAELEEEREAREEADAAAAARRLQASMPSWRSSVLWSAKGEHEDDADALLAPELRMPCPSSARARRGLHGTDPLAVLWDDDDPFGVCRRDTPEEQAALAPELPHLGASAAAPAPGSPDCQPW